MRCMYCRMPDVSGRELTATVFRGGYRTPIEKICDTAAEGLRGALRNHLSKIDSPMFGRFTKSRLVVNGDVDRYGKQGEELVRRLGQATMEAVKIADENARVNSPDAYAKHSDKQGDHFFIIEDDQSKMASDRLSQKFGLNKRQQSSLHESINNTNHHTTAYAYKGKSFFKIRDDMFKLAMSDPKNADALVAHYKDFMAHEISHAKYEMGEYGASMAQKGVDISPHLETELYRKLSYPQRNVSDRFIEGVEKHLDKLHKDPEFTKGMSPSEKAMMAETHSFLHSEKEKLNTPWEKLSAKEKAFHFGSSGRALPDGQKGDKVFWNEYDDIVLKEDMRLDSDRRYLLSANTLGAASVKNIMENLKKRGFKADEVAAFAKKVSSRQQAHIDATPEVYRENFVDKLKHSVFEPQKHGHDKEVHHGTGVERRISEEKSEKRNAKMTEKAAEQEREKEKGNASELSHGGEGFMRQSPRSAKRSAKKSDRG